MKITIRASVFETNSSSSHSLIHMSKKMFDAWKKGEKVLRADGCIITETDIKDTASRTDSDDEDYWTYEEFVESFEELEGECVFKSKAKKEYVDPEEWENSDDDDAVCQDAYMEVIDNGRTVTIHVWGR